MNPDETATLYYKFKPDTMLDARDFVVYVDVFYTNNNNDTFATTFFNETISLVEPSESLDVQSYVCFYFTFTHRNNRIFSYVLMFGILAGLAFAVYQFFMSTKFGKKLSRKTTSQVASDQLIKKEVDHEFVPDHIKQHLTPKPKKPKKE